MQIQITSELSIRDLNYSNDNEIKILAQLYNRVPLSWDRDWQFSESDIQNTYTWLKNKKDYLKSILIIENSAIVGFHILIKETNSSICYIKTLWIEERLRGATIGMKLKQLGEEWAKSVGAIKIVTHVMLNNPTMIEINKKQGFTPIKLEFEKIIK